MSNISKTCKPLGALWRCIYVPGRFLVQRFKSKEITMKQLIALIATAFAVSAFAQAPAASAKPAASAPAAKPAASASAKADVKSAPASDKKAEATKK
jgi:ribosomal protein L7/L12